jgi:tetratricopeptide (TPR) repeat protein
MTAETLFAQALNVPESERSALLARHPELRAQVEALLAAQANAGPVTGAFVAEPSLPGLRTGAFVAEPSVAPPSNAVPTPPTSVIGTLLAGRYTLLNVIGEGGMGSVYLAEQSEPVKRQVALKLIKAGMDSKTVLARFDAERQALALMDHPNIARIYDGGLTPSGQPFFVMELVQGVPLTAYCDAHRLAVNARLQLFVAVCQAVQHAHQKGIIHRDLKPGNVLVTEVDGRPTPKVIDFGVAKATEQKLTDLSLADVGLIVGTPAYMSPEQADASADIDTRTDVYALGVMLYELLVGSPPLDAKQFQRGALLEMLRMVREVEPPRPSTKLSTSDALPNIAANRNIEPAKLTQLLRGELDWVVMKALEKDRTRRYETANGFAADVLRYLADEVVEARPPSRAYRLKKFVKRHKGQVLAASLVLVALVAGIVGTSWGFFEAKREYREAEAARQREAEERAVAVTQRELADAQLIQIEAINNTMFDIFEEFDVRAQKQVKDPIEAVLADKLIEAGKKLDAKTIHDPQVLAKLQRRLGMTVLHLGKTEAAIALLSSALQLRQANVGPDHPDTIESMDSLALALQDAGQMEQALTLLEETLKLSVQKRGPEHIDTLSTMNNLALALIHAGRVAEAVALHEKTLALRKSTLRPTHPHILISMNNLAMAYSDFGNFDKSLALIKETLALTKAEFGPDHADTLDTMNSLAEAYMNAGDFALAIPVCEETYRLRRAKIGPDHPNTLASLHNAGCAYQGVRNYDKAISLLKDALEGRKKILPPDHPDLTQSMNALGLAYQEAGDYRLALPLLEENLQRSKAKFGPEHQKTLTAMNNLALSYTFSGNLDRALPLYEDTFRIRKAKFGTDHPLTLLSAYNLAMAYQAAGQRDHAVSLLAETFSLSKTKLGSDHPDTLSCMRGLGKAYLSAGRIDDALPLFAEYLATSRKKHPNNSPSLAQLLAKVSLDYLQHQQFAPAESLLRECLAIRAQQEPDAWTTFNTMSQLGGILLGQKKYGEAEPLLLAGYQGMKQRETTIPLQGKVRLPEALDRLIELYTATNQPDQVTQWRAEQAKYREILPLPRGEVKHR